MRRTMIFVNTLMSGFICHGAAAQTFKSLYENEICSPPLRMDFFNIQKSDTTKRSHATQKYLWCIKEIRNENEARTQNFDLDLVYEALELSVGTSDRFNKAISWKTDNCGSAQLQQYENVSNEDFRKMLVEPVAIRALDVYGACVANTGYGIYCRAIQNRDSKYNVSFFMAYREMRGGTSAPEVISSGVDNALQISGPVEHRNKIFPDRTKVPPGGITQSFIRTQLDKPVTFSIMLTQGYPGCPPGDLVVPAVPAFTVQAHVEKVEGNKEVTKDYSLTRKAEHRNCYSQMITFPFTDEDHNMCSDDGFIFDKNTFSSAWLPNPYSVGPAAHCFKPSNTYITDQLSGGCLQVRSDIRECSQAEARGGCEWSKSDIGNQGTTVTVNLTGRKTVTSRVGPFDQVWTNASEGLLTLSTPGLPSDLGNVQANWTVNVTNNITGASTTLNNSNPTKDQFSATYDAAERKLNIFVR